MNIIDRFPIFKNNPGLIYLDNAATTQKPQKVIDSISDYYSLYNSNVHRGLYPLSEKSTQMYEDARIKIANFINAEPEEIIFTSGTTDGINSIALSLQYSGILSESPKILLTELEHHSNILPWQRLTKNIEYSSFSKNDDTFNNIEVLAITYVSNVTGQINDIPEIINKIKPKFTVVDAAQAIGHIPLDVKKINADFVVFSGHKMYGPNGVGVIWGKKVLLEKMEPFRVGGGMITSVERNSAAWRPLPEKFEAGTPPIAEAIALAEAANFLSEVGFSKIQEHEQHLRKYLIENLQHIEEIKIYHPSINQKATGVVSFTIVGIHPHDIAQYLGEKNICVRAGHHCTQILHREVLKIPASTRVSLGIYNSQDDIDTFISELRNASEFFRK